MDPSRSELRARRKVRKKRAEAGADPARRPQDAQERLRGPDPLQGTSSPGITKHEVQSVEGAAS